MSSQAVRQFVESLKQSNTSYEKLINRPANEKVSLAEVLDQIVAAGAQRGFQFTRDELAAAFKEGSPSGSALSDKELESVAGGIGFSGLLIGLKNPTTVMCQYHAPRAFFKSFGLNY